MGPSERIPVAGPWITEDDVALVAEAARTAWYGNAGAFHARFETNFAGRVGRRFALALPSCTAALHLALAAAGIGPGDEVVVPELTWIASAAPVSYVGATPVFADVDPRDWCLSAQTLEQAITPRTRAAIVVDLYGNMPDWDALDAVARRHGILLIEDAAEALGSTCRARPAGSFGLASAFSFHGSKTLTTGEGGMLVTDDEALHRRCLVLRDHGRNPGDTNFRNFEIGYKYRMSALQAALGISQLDRLDEMVAFKRKLFGWYRDRLEDLPGLTLNPEPAGDINSAWMVTCVFAPETGILKADLARHLAEAGIDTRPFFHPLSSLPAYDGFPGAAYARARNAVAYRISPHGINLPSGYIMTEGHADRVAQAVRAAVLKNSRPSDQEGGAP